MHTLYTHSLCAIIGFNENGQQKKIYYDENNNEMIYDFKRLINLKSSYVYALRVAD